MITSPCVVVCVWERDAEIVNASYKLWDMTLADVLPVKLTKQDAERSKMVEHPSLALKLIEARQDCCYSSLIATVDRCLPILLTNSIMQSYIINHIASRHLYFVVVSFFYIIIHVFFFYYLQSSCFWSSL